MQIKIAVVVHVFHKDSFKKIRQYLNSLESGVKVFITGSDASDMIAAQPIKNLAAVEVTENLGMDALPFVYMVHKHELWKYDLVIKIHTKNTKSETSIRMMQTYLDHLLTNDALSELKNSFKSNTECIGLWGPVAFARSVEKLIYRNRTHFSLLEKSTGLYYSNKEAIFFAGNMFCVRGVLLKKFSDNYFSIKSMIDAGFDPVCTGMDGSMAHALERFVSTVIRCQSYEVGYIFPKSCSSDGRLVVIPEKKMPFSRYKRYFQAGSNDTSLRSEKISDYSRLDYRSIFNLSKYVDFLGQECVAGINYTAHYLMFSDYLELPSGVELGFSSAMYRLEKPGVFRAGIPSPYHYLSHGKRETPHLFTEAWIKELLTKYLNDSAISLHGKDGQDYRQSLRKLEQFTCRVSGRQCDLSSRDSQEDLVDHKVSMSELLETHIPDLLKARDIIKLQLEHEDYIGAATSAEEFAKKAFLTPDLVEIIAVANTLEFNWKTASYYWNIYLQTKSNKNLLPSFGGARLISYDAEYDPSHIFKNRVDEPINQSAISTLESMGRVCIYTSLFGDYDDLPEIQCNSSSNIEFVAFTDRFHVLADKRWKQIICEADGVSENMSAKKFKIMPHVYLKDYHCSLFVDANTVFTGDISALLSMLHSAGPFVMWRHPLRTNLFMEACAVIASGRASPSIVLNQMATYAQSRIGHHTGLCEGSFIWRRHNDEKVIAFMEEWWSHIISYSHRDQLSLCYLMWRENYYPAIMDDCFGTSRKNVFFYKKRLHKAESKL